MVMVSNYLPDEPRFDTEEWEQIHPAYWFEMRRVNLPQCSGIISEPNEELLTRKSTSSDYPEATTSSPRRDPTSRRQHNGLSRTRSR